MKVSRENRQDTVLLTIELRVADVPTLRDAVRQASNMGHFVTAPVADLLTKLRTVLEGG